jgi:hypothetical protein
LGAAYRLTASWSQAEDLASSTFLIAWRTCADVQLIRYSALPWPHFASGESMVLPVVNRTFMSPPQGEQRPVTSVEVYDGDHALLYEGSLR